MPKRLAAGTVLFNNSLKELEKLCDAKGLEEYEKEIIKRIYVYHQNITFIADTLDFTKFGKKRDFYSVRSINYFHKQAVLKIVQPQQNGFEYQNNF